MSTFKLRNIIGLTLLIFVLGFITGNTRVTNFSQSALLTGYRLREKIPGYIVTRDQVGYMIEAPAGGQVAA